MHSYKVHFSNAEQVFDFVTKIRKFDFDMDLKAGCRIVDAKSIVSAAQSVMLLNLHFRFMQMIVPKFWIVLVHILQHNTCSFSTLPLFY